MTADVDVAAEALARVRTFITEVVRTEPRSALVRRITFGGGDLGEFEPLAPDQFLHLLVPPPGCPTLAIDQSFGWEAWYLMPDETRPVGAYYTVSGHRPEVAELDIDVVLHGDSGPASAWATRAKPGDPAGLWGPRTTFTPPARGRDTDWYLLVADHTGLPALAKLVEALPPATTVRAVVEVPDETEQVPLDLGPSMSVTWLHRGAAPAGTTTALADAVRALDLPAGTPYVWGGGESRSMTAIRRYLRREVGFTREQVSLCAYWRHAAHTDDPPDDET